MKSPDTIYKHNVLKAIEKNHRRIMRKPAYFAWSTAHMNEWLRNHSPIPNMIRNAATYADWHEAEYDTPIGHDGVLGPAWLDIIKSIRTLLNGDCGRLDCGTLDSILLDMVEAAGFDRDEEMV